MTYVAEDHRSCPCCGGCGVVLKASEQSTKARVAGGFMVPNKPFREAYLRLRDTEGLTLSEVGLRLGHTDKGQSVARSLGLQKQAGEIRRFTLRARAVALCEALRLDPMDVGL